MITLRFVTDNDDFVSWAIRGAQLGFWASHVEAVVFDDQGKVAGYLGAHSDGGVQLRPVGYDRAFKPLELFVSIPSTAEQEADFYAFLHSQIGAPYDMDIIKGMASGLLFGQRDWCKPGAWICSELQTMGLLKTAVFRAVAAKYGYVTPRDTLTACGVLAELGEPSPAFPEDHAPHASPVMNGVARAALP